MATQDISLVQKVFQEIADIVTPTMGAKGRMAVINDEFGRPMLTDDGVTVAKNLRDAYKNFEQMIAISMIEAASNTERSAYDGTTLTILLTNELYKQGLKWIESGMHPQQAADKINEETQKVLTLLEHMRIEDLSEQDIQAIATITTKIPIVGKLVADAHKSAGDNMNIIIEHDRQSEQSSIEHTDGMVLDAGYFSEVMQKLCNQKDKTVFDGAFVALLAEGILTGAQMREFFMSIPEEARKYPYVFIVSSGFNPESLRMLTDTLIQNKFTFQFVFINEQNALEIFLDLEAKTNADIQDPSRGTSDYKFNNLGFVDNIVIEIDKTTIISEGNKDKLQARIDKYKKELEENKYTMSIMRNEIISRRFANITAGVTKIKIAVPTVTEYMTIKLKLDDAIGAVKCAIKDGIIYGGGKALYNISQMVPELKDVLTKPLVTICENAGIKDSFLKNRKNKKKINLSGFGVNVLTGEIVNLHEQGIMDSYTSIRQALINASSIASQYLRAFILIKR